MSVLVTGALAVSAAGAANPRLGAETRPSRLHRRFGAGLGKAARPPQRGLIGSFPLNQMHCIASASLASSGSRQATRTPAAATTRRAMIGPQIGAGIPIEIEPEDTIDQFTRSVILHDGLVRSRITY